MMATDKPQNVPTIHNQGVPSQLKKKGNRSKCSTPTVLTPVTSMNRTNSNTLNSSPKPPNKQKRNNNNKSKAHSQQPSQSTSTTPSISTTKSKSSNQKQKQKQSSQQMDKTMNKSASVSAKRDISSKVVIPPRSVEVNFRSNTSSKRATLKSVSDDLKQSTQDIRNLLLAEPCLPNGEKPVFGVTSGSRNNSKKSPTSSSVSLNQSPKLQDKLTSKNSNSTSNVNLSTASRPPSTDSPKLRSSSAGSGYTSSSYAGSTFHAEPKAVTLPRPSFLRK